MAGLRRSRHCVTASKALRNKVRRQKCRCTCGLQVLAGCGELQARLTPDADLKSSLGGMRHSARAFAAAVEGKLDELLSRQGDMLAKQDELGACMQHMRRQLDYLRSYCELPEGYGRALQSGRNLSVRRLGGGPSVPMYFTYYTQVG